MKKVKHAIEAILVYTFFGLFKILPPRTASNVGGWIGKKIGPKLGVTKRAKTHIEMILLEKSKTEHQEIIIKMWENFGRIFAEYAHLESISRNHIRINGTEKLEDYFKTGKPIIFIGGHIGNWEVNGAALLTQFNKDIALTYRPPNNPWVDKILKKCRTINGRIKAFPKSTEGGRQILKTIKNSEHIGILIDQKYNEGIVSNFFDRPAMTNPVFAQLALKYDALIVPVRCERIDGIEFELEINEPIPLNSHDGKPRSVEEIVQETQQVLQEWIEKRPEQWIWLHRRWMKDGEARSKRIKK